MNRILENNVCCGVYRETNTCHTCGLIHEQEFSNYNFEDSSSLHYKKPMNSNSNISKMQLWFMWSPDEKVEYKINKYTTEICKILDVNEHIISQITYFVSLIMKAIKDNFDGPKRARIKNAIIIMCIYYISKNNDGIYNYIELATKLNSTTTNSLHITSKYISKANKIILDLVNSNKLKLTDDFKNNILSINKPIDYINRIINKYKLDISNDIIIQINELLDICDDNDIINDSTSLSLGVGCFYYILEINNISINLTLFSDIYDISTVTILKIYNKLCIHDAQIKKLLNIN